MSDESESVSTNTDMQNTVTGLIYWTVEGGTYCGNDINFQKFFLETQIKDVILKITASSAPILISVN